MRRSKKPIVLGLAFVLIAALSVGGTVAWLTDKTETVTNTFTVGKVDISLKESPLSYGADGSVSYGEPKEGVTNSYRMIPGVTYTKDPVVTVEPSSEDCFLFVKFEEVENAQKYLNYTSALSSNGWTQGKGTGSGGDGIPSNVWYREVMANGSVKSWSLLANNEIYVDPAAVTETTMTVASQAKLVYTAYAIQLYESNSVKFSPEEAWEKVSG